MNFHLKKASQLYSSFLQKTKEKKNILTIPHGVYPDLKPFCDYYRVDKNALEKMRKMSNLDFSKNDFGSYSNTNTNTNKYNSQSNRESKEGSSLLIYGSNENGNDDTLPIENKNSEFDFDNTELEISYKEKSSFYR